MVQIALRLLFKICLPVSPCFLIYNSLEGIYHSILHIVGSQERKAHLKQRNEYDLITVCGCKKPIMQNHLFKELLIDKENLLTSLIRGLADFFLGYLYSEIIF